MKLKDNLLFSVMFIIMSISYERKQVLDRLSQDWAASM